MRSYDEYDDLCMIISWDHMKNMMNMMICEYIMRSYDEYDDLCMIFVWEKLYLYVQTYKYWCMWESIYESLCECVQVTIYYSKVMIYDI